MVVPATRRCTPACASYVSAEAENRAGEMLEEKMRQEDRYAEAMREYLDRTPKELKSEGDRYPGREELHER